MIKTVPAVTAGALLALAVAMPHDIGAASPTPAATATPPPQIIRVYSRPACAELQKHVLPAVAMFLQDDAVIAKSGPIFQDYIQTSMQNGQNGYDTTNYDSPGRTMALQHMEKLVTPLAQNEIAIQQLLENTSLAQPTGNADDDKQLQQLRTDMLKTLAMQRVSLDIINGFVTTEQLGDIQHAGQEYLASINGTGLASTPSPGQTPNPFQDPDQPGLPPNPYDIDPSQIPGIQVGYNPIGKIADAETWVQQETARREAPVAKSMTQLANSCRSATPSP
ncbi:MAG TPA: hypothetical protein VMF61_08760 [Candidatus Acidoferrales bacterium]|nr:hypothetical protein [Candidatus Acidoferrales bacterium]